MFIFIGIYKKMFHVLSLILVLKQQFIKFSSIKLINGRRIRANRDQKSNLLFLQRHVKNFKSNLLKIDKKHYKGINIYYIGYITIKKK